MINQSECKVAQHGLVLWGKETEIISQLAKAINVSADTVRYYKKQGLINPPQRQAKGYRSYERCDQSSI